VTVAEDELPQPARPLLRASNEDRQRIADVLREHTSAGRLTLEEFDERVAAAYAARTVAELRPLLAGLPVDPSAVLPADPDTDRATLPATTDWPRPADWQSAPAPWAGTGVTPRPPYLPAHPGRRVNPLAFMAGIFLILLVVGAFSQGAYLLPLFVAFIVFGNHRHRHGRRRGNRN
jgi:hypothetical protein